VDDKGEIKTTQTRKEEGRRIVQLGVLGLEEIT
jgi:hypothetical protein